MLHIKHINLLQKYYSIFPRYAKNILQLNKMNLFPLSYQVFGINSRDIKIYIQRLILKRKIQSYRYFFGRQNKRYTSGRQTFELLKYQLPTTLPMDAIR